MHADRTLELDNLELAFEGDRDGILELLDMALADSLERAVKLSAALDRDDVAAAAPLAHAIKGAAANVGAFDLSSIAAAMESALRCGDVRAAGDARAAMSDAFLQFEAAIAAYRSRA